MLSSRLQGVIAASITPITADLNIDVPRLAAHMAQLLAQGCSYVSSFGTTGEGASLSTAQKILALQALKGAGVDMSRQIPAVMTPTLDDAVQLVIAYGALGCRGALVLPPFYYNSSEAGIAAFYDALVARTTHQTNIDLLLYNIPQLSRVRFTPALVNTILSRHAGRIVGLKDSTGDLDSGLTLVRTFPGLAVFTGDDRVLPHLVAQGGAGMIGGMPNVFARDLVTLYKNPQNTVLLHKQTERILAVDKYGSLVALKAALAHYGHDEQLARPLPPLMALGEQDRAALIHIFDTTGHLAAA